jgi:hypothetical protein
MAADHCQVRKARSPAQPVADGRFGPAFSGLLFAFGFRISFWRAVPPASYAASRSAPSSSSRLRARVLLPVAEGNTLGSSPASKPLPISAGNMRRLHGMGDLDRQRGDVYDRGRIPVLAVVEAPGLPRDAQPARHVHHRAAGGLHHLAAHPAQGRQKGSGGVWWTNLCLACITPWRSVSCSAGRRT